MKIAALTTIFLFSITLSTIDQQTEQVQNYQNTQVVTSLTERIKILIQEKVDICV